MSVLLDFGFASQPRHLWHKSRVPASRGLIFEKNDGYNGLKFKTNDTSISITSHKHWKDGQECHHSIDTTTQQATQLASSLCALTITTDSSYSTGISKTLSFLLEVRVGEQNKRRIGKASLYFHQLPFVERTTCHHQQSYIKKLTFCCVSKINASSIIHEPQMSTRTRRRNGSRNTMVAVPMVAVQKRMWLHRLSPNVCRQMTLTMLKRVKWRWRCWRGHVVAT